MKIKKVLWNVVLLAILSACGEDADRTRYDENIVSVRFTSVIEGEIVTRAYGSSWSSDDLIGVFMKKSGEELSAGSVLDNANNVPFITKAGDGNFLPQDINLKYPIDGTPVDFVAYYPYKDIINDYIYKIDIADQKNPETIDFLYADNLKGRTKNSVTGNLQFAHQLSQLVLNLSSSDNSDLSELSVVISGIKTKAGFNLTNATLNIDESSEGTVEMNRVGNTMQAVLLPVNTMNGVKLTLSLRGKTKEILLPASIASLKKGIKYFLSVDIKNAGSQLIPEEEKYQKWRETPVITKEQLADPQNMYVVHDMPNAMKDPVSGKTLRNYALLFNTDLKIAYWVAYPLFAEALFGVDRKDAWDYDPLIPKEFQANLKSGFTGTNYDRGHQLPSADRLCDRETNKTTFYYSNMTPQIGKKLNQSIWQELEKKVRSWVSGTDTVFVVTGAIPPKNGEIERQKGMAVPEYYFKALARKIGGTFYTIAFKLDNQEYVGRDFMQWAISVKELEQTTGFTFFPSLDARAKELDVAKWQ
ncbi:hypothetical protein IX307_000145 [Bacteroides pyogenes]|uniref:fimbrillin family protein n=1 Tax=Bacteroides pyogenes TaxID=310300 RepID=UPI001BAB48CE|nr:DNA/RNA non-specific endonuclease [Bacteroides pyogenes]MBR8707779.1 hypothetical protein [Bacteroides pyogenes]MBR8717648.1 hypothetical protein [Bacteroides pyogenes]MBR8719028.1 hypothetical protein [Bacteroides pyogenes]MBR8723834.1 hypothetical protein [Bacteroides pyogenes]MBR8737299.1 hypothetical protein [Bacteroides pyogenes]